MTEPTQPIRIAADWGRPEIGAYLRSLREQYAITLQHVSERLHIRARYITAIEEAQYEQMPGKVYARGYLHTYAEFLGLDPEQVVAQCFEDVIPESAAPKVVPAFGRLEQSAVKPAPAATRPPSTAAKTAAPTAAPAYAAKEFGSPKVSYAKPWLLPAVVTSIVVMVLVVRWAVTSPSSGFATDSGVSPVPEALLNSVRSEVMPNAQNYGCLSEETVLGCFFAQDSVQELQEIEDWAPNKVMDGIKLAPGDFPAATKPAAEEDDAE